jgi:hypothetical protein
VLPVHFADLWSTDRARQNTVFASIMDETSRQVPWAYEAWDELVANLSHKDNHNRAIAAQVLCNLGAHDPGDRILGDLDALVRVTYDARFVTARHCLLSLWKIGIAGPTQRTAVIATLKRRYHDTGTEKSARIIRSDIVASLRQLRDATGDETIEPVARELIEAEPDPTYRRKYAGHWR